MAVPTRLLNATITRIDRPIVAAAVGEPDTVAVLSTPVRAHRQDRSRAAGAAGERHVRETDSTILFAERTFYMSLEDAPPGLITAQAGDLVTWVADEAPAVVRSAAEVVELRVWSITTIKNVELLTVGGT